jgi:Calcium binding
MPQPPHDEEREQRIELEIIVDANGPEEQALGWYNYLEENLQFPFLTRCIRERAISPLRVGDEVEVVGMGPGDECAHEMFVLTPWERRTLAIPLSQLESTVADEQTIQAVEDWHYWVERGYEL